MDEIQGTSTRHKTPSSRPLLSVIVPVYNGANVLPKCLTALAESQYDNFDVLVVDDGSTEPIEPLVTPYGFDYARVDGPRGPGCARNHGAEHCTGQYVVFIDADVCVHQDTLARFAEIFAADPTIDAVVGSYDDAPAETNFLSQYKNLFHHFVHQNCDGEINTFWSGCGAIRRETFLASGGFDTRRYRHPAIEDIELGTWMSVSGRRIVLDSRIKAKHLKRWTFWNLVKTDIFDRGVPWTRLMLRVGTMVNTLNVKRAQRLSVALVYLMGMSVLMTARWPAFWLSGVSLALAVTVVNYDFYRYFVTRSGLWFTLRILPLHWLYFGYCGFCVIWGTVLHYFEKTTGTPSTSLQSFRSDK